MKKFLMLSMLICGAMSGAWGAENCNLMSGDIYTKANQDERFDISDTSGYVCDADVGDDECPYGAVIIRGDEVVQCYDQWGVEDTWVSFAESVEECLPVDISNYSKGALKRSGKYLLGSNFKEENGVVVCKLKNCSDGHAREYSILYRVCEITNDEMIACYEAQKEGDPAEWKTDNGGYCTCNDKEGFEPVWNSTTKRCNKTGRGDTVTCDGSSVGTVLPADLGKCKDRYKSYAGGDKITSCKKKCSDKGSWLYGVTSCADGWEPDTEYGDNVACKEKKKQGGANPGTNPGVVGKCHPSVCQSEVCKACCAKPKTETIWERGAQVCQCVNGGKFTKENNQWICKVDNSQPVVPSGQCDATLLARVQGWKTQCAGKTEVLAEIDGLLAYCAGKAVDNDVFLRLYDELKALVDEKCAGSSEQPPQVDELRVSIRIIRDAHSNLSGMAEGFKKSVWKDEEGKFNTSRLVSDSVAGVVLGTAGGLITSNVVKKNQVENGFEDLKCTIGGQVVADWGDQFRVGIQ